MAMRNYVITRSWYLLIVLLLATVGCANQTPKTQKSADRPDTNQGGHVTLSGRLSNTEYESGESIEITAIVNNSGSIPVTLTEGCFKAVFIVGGEAKTFLQAVRSSYASGTKTLTISPGEVYEEPFTVSPKDWADQRKLVPGQYRMRISYFNSSEGGIWPPAVNRVANRIDLGIVKNLDSEDITVRIK